MKKLTVTEYCYFFLGKDYIRLSGQILVIFSISVALMPQSFPKCYLNRRILTFNMLHILPALFLSQIIHIITLIIILIIKSNTKTNPLQLLFSHSSLCLPSVVLPNSSYCLPQSVRPAMLMVRMGSLMLVEDNHRPLLRIFKIEQNRCAMACQGYA